MARLNKPGEGKQGVRQPGWSSGRALVRICAALTRGDRLFEWRRDVWAVLFLAAAFCFAYILLNPATGYLGTTRVSPLIPALILFLAFGAASVLFWGYFRFRPARAA